MEAKQCLNVLRQLGKSGIATLQALKGLNGRGLSLAALIASGCEISRLDFNIFMSWLILAVKHECRFVGRWRP